MPHSPICPARWRGKRFFVKRDDLINPLINGNKARKLQFLYPLVKAHKLKRIVSYGSMQSNAMYALTIFAKLQGLEFHYYARINESLLANPKGNLKVALFFGMKLFDMKEAPNFLLKTKNTLSTTIQKGDTLYIPEGIRCKEAEDGIAMLALEIERWARKPINIFLPSGTGTTALYLKKHLHFCPLINEVYTVACVADNSYLQEQFSMLEPNTTLHPKILEPPRRYKFAKPYIELYKLWQEVKKESGIIFDLIYDPIGFATILHHNLLNSNLLYIHQGGLLGNETMIERYKKKFATIS